MSCLLEKTYSRNRCKNIHKPNDTVIHYSNITTGRLTIEVHLVLCASVAVYHYPRFSCSILALYRGSFNVSIGLGEASCAGQEVPCGISPRAE